MFRVKTYNGTFKKSESGEPQEGVFFRLGVRGQDGAKPEDFLMDTGMLDGPPVAITTELAKKYNLQPTEQVSLTIASDTPTQFPVAKIDLVIEDVTLRQIPCLIGTPVSMIGYKIFCLMDIQFHRGQVVKIALNNDAINEMFARDK
ncbi:MAG: hypothetical protein AB7F86_01290 [Bdellovibrionales bacterium]